MASLFMRKFDRNASVFSSDDPGHKRLRQFRLLELVAERLNGNWKIANSSDSNLQETYAAYKLVEKIVSSKSLMGSTPISRTVELRVVPPVAACRVSVAVSDCGTAQCSQRYQPGLRLVSDSGGDSPVLV